MVISMFCGFCLFFVLFIFLIFLRAPYWRIVDVCIFLFLLLVGFLSRQSSEGTLVLDVKNDFESLFFLAMVRWSLSRGTIGSSMSWMTYCLIVEAYGSVDC